MKRVKFLHVSKITLLRRTLKRAPQVVTCHPILDLLGKVLSKHLDILYIYYTRLNYQLKFMALVMVYVKICGGRQINRHAKSCSCLSYSGSYCDSNIKMGTETCAAHLIFVVVIWYNLSRSRIQKAFLLTKMHRFTQTLLQIINTSELTVQWLKMLVGDVASSWT